MQRSAGFLLKGLSLGWLFLCACAQNEIPDPFKDTTPTSGKLRIYYDEGLHLHVKNQAFTFESQYERAQMILRQTSEDEAVQALISDSCEMIVISRPLNENEKRRFASRRFNPRVTPVAQSGIAFIASAGSPIKDLSVGQLMAIASTAQYEDSGGVSTQCRLLFDKTNSSVLHYFVDSIAKKTLHTGFISGASGTEDCLSYVAGHPMALGVIDFAWLSDRDDPVYKNWIGKIRVVGVRSEDGVVYPSQSSFKTGTYPFTRTVNLVRKTGEFTLAKGFETFVAGPKGQLTFLKQGLMPIKQAERTIEVNFEPVGEIE